MNTGATGRRVRILKRLAAWLRRRLAEPARCRYCKAMLAPGTIPDVCDKESCYEMWASSQS